MNLVPKKFFITSGCAVSKVSDLNAFDEALKKARIGEQNLVSVSSVLPIGARQVPVREMPMGMVTFCVLAQMRGGEGEMISAGIAYAFRKDGKGGYVAEGHMHGTKKALKEVLEWKMTEMSKLRGIELRTIHYAIEELSIPMDHYGACVGSCVFVEY
ncbi:MAG TPA: pyruvoyl-dependent arginine decarboxylase [Methanomassiliicoccales archaeon]|jgi:arginine decarboxylase|nr:pyruvoyl-dependent arginine decarboxylase [Methanomassiliicoccales archaeon]